LSLPASALRTRQDAAATMPLAPHCSMLAAHGSQLTARLLARRWAMVVGKRRLVIAGCRGHRPKPRGYQSQSLSGRREPEINIPVSARRIMMAHRRTLLWATLHTTLSQGFSPARRRRWCCCAPAKYVLQRERRWMQQWLVALASRPCQLPSARAGAIDGRPPSVHLDTSLACDGGDQSQLDGETFPHQPARAAP